jgi:hypothetical protein
VKRTTPLGNNLKKKKKEEKEFQEISRDTQNLNPHTFSQLVLGVDRL